MNFKHKPTVFRIQRITHSPRCGSNCAKGGVQRNNSLWTRGASDSECFVGDIIDGANKKSQKYILEMQRLFQEKDLVDGKVV